MGVSRSRAMLVHVMGLTRSEGWKHTCVIFVFGSFTIRALIMVTLPMTFYPTFPDF